MGKKRFWVKKIWAPEKICPQKIWVQKICVKKNFGPRKIEFRKKCLASKNLGPNKYFVSEQDFGSEKSFWVKKSMGRFVQKFRTERILCLKKLYVKKT